MIPACGIETFMLGLFEFRDDGFQINDSRLRDWNFVETVYQTTLFNPAFKLMIPACGIETCSKIRLQVDHEPFKLMIPACGIETITS